VFTAQFQAGHVTLKDADAMAAACNVYYVMRMRVARAVVRYIT